MHYQQGGEMCTNYVHKGEKVDKYPFGIQGEFCIKGVENWKKRICSGGACIHAGELFVSHEF
jgi:hypothetical protein